jgi:peptide/nickel transport system ATP-binding protein
MSPFDGADTPEATATAASVAGSGAASRASSDAARPGEEPLLRVEDLRVSYATEDGTVQAVDGISYELGRGRTLGIVGESGSGKTVGALSVLGLTRAEGATVSGRIAFEGRDLLALEESELRAIRGEEIAMVFQDPLSALHPMYRVGAQIVEAIRAHRDLAKAPARVRAIDLLDLVGIPEPSVRVDSYPHELSGGQRQRAMIAMALSGDPKLLIADEPTTALDVTVQAQILALLSRLQRERGMALVLVTHDLGVVAEMADEIAVMYAGRIVERAPAERLFTVPEHPYTWGLLRSIPTLDGPREELLTPIPGSPPSPLAPPSGCRFHPRCPYSEPEHARTDPALEPVPGRLDHEVACLLDSGMRRRLWAELRDRRGDAPERVDIRESSAPAPAPESAA